MADPGVASRPAMHSSTLVILANKPKINEANSGFTPVTSGNTLILQHVPPSSTPPRDAPTPGEMQARPPSRSTPPLSASAGLQQPLVLPSGAAPGPSHHAMKYQEHPGGDTFSDFVSLVCQEAQNSHSQASSTTPPMKSPTKLPHFFSPGMLPPPPPPPPTVARPVAILRTSDGQTVISSGSPVMTTNSSSNSMGVSSSPGTPPINRTIMSSPFSVLTRPEHAFPHIHPQAHQVFTYPSLSPVNAISGVISPTTLSLIASPVATPRSTPRSTPIPRWTTPFIPLDEGMGMDYNMLASFMHGVNSDEPLLNEDRFFAHNNEAIESSNNSNNGQHTGTSSGNGGGSSHSSHPPGTPQAPSSSKPHTPSQQQT